MLGFPIRTQSTNGHERIDLDRNSKCLQYLTLLRKRTSRASKMAQWIKELATKPDDLSLTPGTHVVK